MKYVYYNGVTGQIMATFETPNLVNQASWEARGFLRAVVQDGVTATRDHTIGVLGRVEVNSTLEDCVTSPVESRNPEQPVPSPRTRLDDLQDKLVDNTATLEEMRELLRLDRGL